MNKQEGHGVDGESKRSDRYPEKGDGTVSAITQNHVYTYGKKKPEAKVHVVSTEKMEELKRSVGKYLTEKKK